MSRAAVNIALVKYAGNGADDREISLGVTRPRFALVRRNAGSEAIMSAEVGSGRNRGHYPASTSANLSNTIQGFTDAGMVVGTSVAANGSGSTYYGFAIGYADGQNLVRAQSYSGDGNASRVWVPPFFGDVFITKNTTNAASTGRIKTTAMPEATSAPLNGNNFDSLAIGAMTADGIALRNHVSCNSSTADYAYLLLKNVPGYIASGIYTGNGTALSVTGLGFAPDVVCVKTTSSGMVMLTRDQQDDEAGAWNWLVTASAIADSIVSLDADGFTVGASAYVNVDSASSYWFALKSGSFNPAQLGRTAA